MNSHCRGCFFLSGCLNLLHPLVNLFPRDVPLSFNSLFELNSLYLFHRRSTAEGFFHFRELSAAVERGLEAKDWRRFHTMNHLRIAARLLYLFSLLFFSLLSATSFLYFPLLNSSFPFPQISSERRSLH